MVSSGVGSCSSFVNDCLCLIPICLPERVILLMSVLLLMIYIIPVYYCCMALYLYHIDNPCMGCLNGLFVTAWTFSIKMLKYKFTQIKQTFGRCVSFYFPIVENC